MAEPIKEKEEEILEAEIVEEVSLILDNIVFSTFTKNGKTEYKSSALDRKLVVLSPTSHLPEPGRSYQVKVIEDTQPDNPKKGKLIVEIYYGSVEARAQDLTSQINEKMAKLNAKEVAEQTEVELDEVAKLYKEIEALYKSTESAETIEDRGEWLKKFEKKALLEINAIAAKYPNNVKLKDIVKNLCGFDSDEAWKWRETAWAAGDETEIQSTLEGLAGVDSEKAWKMRDYILQTEGRLDRLAVSLAGLDSERAWEMREAILAKDPFLNSIIGEGLAGIESPTAWEMRTKLLQQGVNTTCIARGLAGVDSPKAWKMRGALLEESEPPLNALAESLAGLDSDIAWKFREELIKTSGANLGNVSMGLSGLDSDKAWAMRDFITHADGNSSMTPVVVGLPGVDSPRAWKMRKELLEKDPGAARIVIESLAGNHITFVWQLNKEKRESQPKWYVGQKVKIKKLPPGIVDEEFYVAKEIIISDIAENGEATVKALPDGYALAMDQADLEEIFEPAEGNENERQMEFEDIFETEKVIVTDELEKWGLKVGQKLTLKNNKKIELAGTEMERAKDLVVVGFTKDDRIVIQLDGGKTTFTYPGETFQEFFDIVGRRMKFASFTGETVEISEDLEGYGLHVGQKVKLKPQVIIPLVGTLRKEFMVVGFTKDGFSVVIQADGGLVTTDYKNQSFEPL